MAPHCGKSFPAVFGARLPAAGAQAVPAVRASIVFRGIAGQRLSVKRPAEISNALAGGDPSPPFCEFR